jgi:hypothetical protein
MEIFLRVLRGLCARKRFVIVIPRCVAEKMFLTNAANPFPLAAERHRRIPAVYWIGKTKYRQLLYLRVRFILIRENTVGNHQPQGTSRIPHASEI